MAQTADLLRSIPLLRHLSDADLTALSDEVSRQSLRKGQILFRKGSKGRSLFIIQEGAIKIVLPSNAGGEVAVAIFKEGDFFGEMALLDHRPRSADAVAVSPSRLLVLEKETFSHFLKNSESAIDMILCSLAQRIRNTDALIEDTCFLKIPNRLAKKLLELADSFGRSEGKAVRICLPLTQKEIADMIGATRESINKEMKILRQSGIIALSDRNICILDPARLHARSKR